MTFAPVIQHAVFWGLIFSAVFFVFVVVVLKINPEIMIKDYPPDIRAKYGAISERGRKQRILFGSISLLVMVAVIAAACRGLHALTAGDVSFRIAFVHAAVMLTVFNVIDWLIIDWLVFVRFQPKFAVLPGTEGMAGYRDYFFHFRGFLIGIPITLVGAAVVAAINSSV